MNWQAVTVEANVPFSVEPELAKAALNDTDTKYADASAIYRRTGVWSSRRGAPCPSADRRRQFRAGAVRECLAAPGPEMVQQSCQISGTDGL